METNRYVRVLREYRHPIDILLYGLPIEYVSKDTYETEKKLGSKLFL